jgi:hypothetical protein
VIKYYKELQQGSDEWLQARCGLLTASEMKLIMTASMKVANNDKERSHLYDLAAQRINQHVEPAYVSDDMLRGQADEVEARILYAEKYAPVGDMGFITNDKWGFTIGYSPDGMVGDDGLIECKSRRQKYQMETLVKCVPVQVVPEEYLLQLQTGLLVSERQWIDLVSYSGGMPMAVIRAYPDEKIQNAIVEAAGAFEKKLAAIIETYESILASGVRLVPTERRDDGEGEVFV